MKVLVLMKKILYILLDSKLKFEGHASSLRKEAGKKVNV